MISGATKAPGAGKVKVHLGTTLLKTVALEAATTKCKQVISVAAFGSRKSGVVKIVTTSRKPVTIEGLGVSAK